MSNRVGLVTGANSGIGKEIALGLARAGATVIMACRDRGRGMRARDELMEATGSTTIELELVDVAEPASVAKLCGRVLRRHRALHVLVNNAGAWFDDRRENSAGVELTWATNVLGPYATVAGLRPALVEGEARVVNVGSHLAHGLDLDDLDYVRRRYRGFGGAYPQSKQGLLMLSWAQASRLRRHGVTVNVAEPEWTRTACHRHASWWRRLVMNTAGTLFARTAKQGADTALWLSMAPELAGKSGGDYLDRQPLEARFADDRIAIDRVWRRCVAATGIAWPSVHDSLAA